MNGSYDSGNVTWIMFVVSVNVGWFVKFVHVVKFVIEGCKLRVGFSGRNQKESSPWFDQVFQHWSLSQISHKSKAHLLLLFYQNTFVIVYQILDETFAHPFLYNVIWNSYIPELISRLNHSWIPIKTWLRWRSCQPFPPSAMMRTGIQSLAQ